MRYLGLAREKIFSQDDAELAKDISTRPWRTFTPDLLRLEKQEWWLLFLCDGYMSSRREHHAIEGEGKYKPIVGFTKDTYDYLISEDGVALPVPSADGWQIKGEIHVVHPSTIIKLDKFKLNSVHFNRKRVDILDPYRPYGYHPQDVFNEDGTPTNLSNKQYWLGEEHLHTQQCFMYVCNKDHWEYAMKRRPESFDRVPKFKPKKDKKWLNDYFYYQNPAETD